MLRVVYSNIIMTVGYLNYILTRLYFLHVAEINYIVKVFTGDVHGAGTDANIFLKITGEFGDTGEIQLKHSDHMNKFERGQVGRVFTDVALVKDIFTDFCFYVIIQTNRKAKTI